MKIIINTGGKNFGPYKLHEVREMLKEGAISANDFAWFEDGTEWMSVTDAIAKFKPPVSLTARLNRSSLKPDPRTQTNQLLLRAKKSSSLSRPLY